MKPGPLVALSTTLLGAALCSQSTVPSNGANAPVPTPGLVGTAQHGLADAAFLEFGEGIGVTGLHVSVANGVPEVVLATGTLGNARGNVYWFILRHDPGSGRLQRVFSSSARPQNELIRQLEVADVLPDPGPEVIVVDVTGRVEIWNQASRTLVTSFQTMVNAATGLAVGDIDGDQQAELLLTQDPGGTWVIGLDGTIEWSTSEADGEDIVFGQMDGDPALEIATSDGNVIDYGLRAVQWNWPATFADDLEVADIDGDGFQELLTSERQGFIWSYDVDTGLPKWSIATRRAERIEVAQLDGDPAFEVVAGDDFRREMKAYDTVTRQQELVIQNPGYGTSSITHGDVDGDGQTELLWGGGFGSTAEDNLFVADPATQTIEWRSIHLDGPFFGPLRGDIDGDGTSELVTMSSESGAGYDGARVVVLDETDLSVIAISNELTALEGRDFGLYDFDGNGDMELVVVGGAIDIVDFDGQSFTSVWNLPRSYPLEYYSAEIADLDGDGRPEVLAGASQFLFAYDLATKNELWRSFYLGHDVPQVVLGDTDGDNQTEVHALSSDGDVYVFGPDGTAEAALFHTPHAEFVEMSALRLNGSTLLATGASDGALNAYLPTGGGYLRLGPVPFVGEPINGLDLVASSLFLVGAGDTLRIQEGLVPAWTSAPYGEGFATDTLLVPGTRSLYAGGRYGVVVFRF